jgi:uncharacterized protein (TIRG00374 family)
MADRADGAPRPRRRSGVNRNLRRVLSLLVLALVVEYLVLPQIAGARKALALLAHADVGFLLAGIGFEALSLLAYAKLTRSMLPASQAPELGTVVRIDLSTLAVSHIVPGGSAAGTGIGFRLLTNEGVTGSDAGFALGMQGFGSALVLNVLLWLALVVSIPLYGFNPLYGTAAIVGVILIGAFSGLVLLLTRGEDRAAKVLRSVARRAPFLNDESIDRLIRHLAARLRTLAGDRQLLARAVIWAAANWILDAASLWVFIRAFGQAPDVDGLLVAYGLANVLAAIPVTPGGLGVVEAVLTSSLVGFGVARGVAVLGVVSYRLVNFWLPIPAGGLAYLSLRARAGKPTRPKEAFRRLADQAVTGAEDRVAWAERHGVELRRNPSRHDGKA